MRHEFAFRCVDCRRVVATAAIDGETLGAGTCETLTDIYCAACVAQRERAALHWPLPVPTSHGRGGTAALGLATAVLALVFGLVAGAGPAHADEPPPPLSPDVLSWSDYAKVDALALQGAVNTTGASPEDYLVGAGIVTRTPEPVAAPADGRPIGGALGQRIYCIEGIESHHGLAMYNPTAIGNGEHAQGWLGYLPSTAASVGVVIGNRASEWQGAAFMLSHGRGGEFYGVRAGLC